MLLLSLDSHKWHTIPLIIKLPDIKYIFIETENVKVLGWPGGLNVEMPKVGVNSNRPNGPHHSDNLIGHHSNINSLNGGFFHDTMTLSLSCLLTNQI